MDIINILIGVLSNILGVLLINYYLSLVKKKQHGGLSINLLSAGIGAVIIGVVYIYNEIKHLF